MGLSPHKSSFRTFAVVAGLGVALTAAPGVANAEELAVGFVSSDMGNQNQVLLDIDSGADSAARGISSSGTFATDGVAVPEGGLTVTEEGDGSNNLDDSSAITEDPDAGVGGAGSSSDDQLTGSDAVDGSEALDDTSTGESVEGGPVENPGQEGNSDVEDTVPAGDASLSDVQATNTASAGLDSMLATDQPEEQSVSDSSLLAGTWLVEEASDGSGLQRYYILESGEKAQGLFKAMLAGVESWFYAYGEDGRIVRGRVSVDGKDGITYTYLADNDGRLLDPGWHVTDDFGQGLQRYYIDAEAHACVEGYSADGWGHYTRPEGYVVRGKYDTGAGTVVLADNDGRTATGSGWLVTGAYDGGGLQRYWLIGDGQARSSYFEVDGRWYFGLGGEGYVLRGVGRGVDGSWLTADNDGRLAEGWVVTSAFGQGLQRYWFVDGRMAKEGVYHTSGSWWTYVTDKGYVLRGKYDNGAGRVYLADNDGRLASLGSDGTGSGWLVTGIYDNGGLQRYYIDGKAHAAVSGFFTYGGSTYFGLGNQGYVLRGRTGWGNQVLLANNDGVMAYGEGWLVSDDYGQGLQRYWIEGIAGQPGYYGAKTGFFHIVDGHAVSGRASDVAGYYYGRSEGYVLRGGMNVNGEYLYADNDGVIAAFLNGIDISNWQKGMDVSKIASNFIIVKVSEGSDYLNQSFKSFADAVLAAGKQLGLYHFYHTEASPEEQADFFVSQVRPYVGQAVLILDWEDTTGSNAIAQGPAVAKRFLDRVYEQTGVRSLIYMSSSVARNSNYDWSPVANSGYGLWVAQYLYKYYDTTNGIDGYVQNPTLSDGNFGAWGRDVTMYQYTSTGKLDGWNGFLDFNVFYGTKDDWKALATPIAKAATAAVRAVASMSLGADGVSQESVEV